MCHPLVRAHLAKVVGEVTKTLGVWDFETPEDLGCSILERSESPEGWSGGHMWHQIRYSGGLTHQKEASVKG
jgi:hypothetical protein